MCTSCISMVPLATLFVSLSLSRSAISSHFLLGSPFPPSPLSWFKSGYSWYLTAARRRRGPFFLLVDLGPGAAVGRMWIEINPGYRCYLITIENT